MRSTKISRRKLNTYAQVLGRDSIAAEVLRRYDEAKAIGDVVEIHMTNNDFRLVYRSIAMSHDEAMRAWDRQVNGIY